MKTIIIKTRLNKWDLRVMCIRCLAMKANGMMSLKISYCDHAFAFAKDLRWLEQNKIFGFFIIFQFLQVSIDIRYADFSFKTHKAVTTQKPQPSRGGERVRVVSIIRILMEDHIPPLPGGLRLVQILMPPGWFTFSLVLIL